MVPAAAGILASWVHCGARRLGGIQAEELVVTAIVTAYVDVALAAYAGAQDMPVDRGASRFVIQLRPCVGAGVVLPRLQGCGGKIAVWTAANVEEALSRRRRSRCPPRPRRRRD